MHPARSGRATMPSTTGATARATHYGYLYSFWRRAEEKKVECGGGASAKHCTVSAKPCRVY